MSTHATFAEILGVDPSELEWQDLALCSGMDTEKFYERYETNPRTARAVDDLCLSCPVQALCLAAGINNSEWGVWGGVYLENGRAKPERNSHKTKETWDRIRNGI